jgi:ATP-binding cassette, subfamily B, multidrug efflux pump
MTVKSRNTKKPISGWYLLWDYFRMHPFVYVISIASIGGSSMLAVYIPRIIGRFADTFKSGTLSFDDARHYGLLVLGVGLARVTLGWLGRVLSAQHGRIIMYKIREALFIKWETLSPSYYHKHSIGELLSHALSDVDVVRQVASMGINITVNGIFMLGAALYVMILHMHWQLAVAGLGPLVAIPVLVRYFGPRIRSQSARFQAALGSMSQTVEEIFGGIRTVKAFGNEEVVIRKFDGKVDAIVNEKMRFVRLSSIFGALVPLMAALGFIVVLVYGSQLTIRGVITLGDFVAFLLYLTLLRQPLEQLGNMLNVIQRASASLSRLAELLLAPVTVFDRNTHLSNAPVRGDIDVRNLSFRYPDTGTEVLRDVSFSVRQGKTLGIIGPIGSGKTTLAHLLLRLYEPPHGALFIDGTEIHDFYLEHLRTSIAYVPQNGFLFSTKVLDNIAFSEDVPDDARAREAARLTVVDNDIAKFSDEYATEIGERGVRLSGGQKQRVAIARMIYKDAPIHILDDSLSAVDTKTERSILGNMRIGKHAARTGPGKTTIIISHRLSAVMHADEILILEQGRITGRGSHEDLLKAGGLYSRLWNMQSGTTGRSEPVAAGDVDKTGLLEVLLEEEENAVKAESAEEGA